MTMVDADLDSRPNSRAAHARACRVLVGGVNSPVRAFKSVGGTPVTVRSARGPLIEDLDGRTYIDYVNSWGPAIVGHAHPEVVEAVREAVGAGLSFGAPCEAETRLAEIVLEAFSGPERIRFVNSGTEACMSAIRLARAATGRTKIVKFAGNYHGHADAVLVEAGSGAVTHGVPSSPGVIDSVAGHTLTARYNDLDSVRALVESAPGDIAAIVVEPVAGNMGLVRPVDGFLEGLREICDAHGCLLVFDEVMTGFRVAWGGYQNICGVRPDLTCLGKVVGGGMPVAAYLGRSELMDQVSPSGPVYQAGTLSGNPVAMAAGIATLEICGRPGFHDELDARANRLAAGIAELGRRHDIEIRTDAIGGMLGIAFSDRPIRDFEDAQAGDHRRFAAFFHAMLERGVWLPPSGYEAWFLSDAHEEDHLDRTLAAVDEGLESLS